MIVVVLTVVTKQQEKQFQVTQFELQKTLLTQTANRLSRHIAAQRESLQQFVIQHQSLLRQLRHQPQDVTAYAALEQRIAQQFPDSAAFMIVMETGMPVWLDFGFKVGPVCAQELERFSEEVKRSKYKARNPVLIHPNLSQYHYDLMAAWPLDPVTNNVFFLSFHAEALAAILKQQQQPGHQLMLVRKGDTALIEVTAAGARDKIKRPIRLDNSELQRLQTFSEVEGTDWRLVDLTNSGLLNQRQRVLWMKAAGLSLVLVVSVIILLILMRLRVSQRSLF